MTRVRGYASYFNVRNGHGEIMLPGAFDRSVEHVLAGGRIPFYAVHGWAWPDGWGGLQRNTGRDALPIGVVDLLRQDELGLYFEAELFADQADQLVGAVRSTLAALGPRPASVAWSHNGAVTEETKANGVWTLLVHSVPVLEEISIVHSGSDPLAYVELAPDQPASEPAQNDEPPAPAADTNPPAAAGQENP